MKIVANCMKIVTLFLFPSLVLCSLPSNAFAEDGILIRCGASFGQGYFFHDNAMNPDGPYWRDDAISNGKINLVKLGDEWDIFFDDALGGYSYRKEGGVVLLLGESKQFLTVGAFFQDAYAEIYTFDFIKREVAWSSNKIGPILPKVSIFRASCE